MKNLKKDCETKAKSLAKAIDKITKHPKYQDLKNAVVAEDQILFATILRTMGIDPVIEAELVAHCLDTGSVSFSWV